MSASLRWFRRRSANLYFSVTPPRDHHLLQSLPRRAPSSMESGSSMPDQPFVHLHCHTHYSLLDGASRIPELVALAKSLGMNAIAVTDHGNLFGAIEFYQECRSAGINPIVGYEAYVAPGKRSEREAKRRGEAGYHLTLLA